jgi:di/tricarboxylate transporter
MVDAPLLKKALLQLEMSVAAAKGALEQSGRSASDIDCVIVACSILFWATDRWHHLPSFFIGMIGLAAFALAGIVTNADIGPGISWTLLLFMGGIFSLSNVLTEYKITDWLAGYFVPVAEHLTFNAIVLLVVVAIGMFMVRFLDPSGFIALAACAAVCVAVIAAVMASRDVTA